MDVDKAPVERRYYEGRGRRTMCVCVVLSRAAANTTRMNLSIDEDNMKFSCGKIDKASKRYDLKYIRVVGSLCVYGINMFLLLYIYIIIHRSQHKGKRYVRSIV
jgi:hypothetical protein